MPIVYRNFLITEAGIEFPAVGFYEERKFTPGWVLRTQKSFMFPQMWAQFEAALAESFEYHGDEFLITIASEHGGLADGMSDLPEDYPTYEQVDRLRQQLQEQHDEEQRAFAVGVKAFNYATIATETDELCKRGIEQRNPAMVALTAHYQDIHPHLNDGEQIIDVLLSEKNWLYVIHTDQNRILVMLPSLPSNTEVVVITSGSQTLTE